MMANGISRYRAGVVGDWAVRTANLTNADHYRQMWDERFPDSSQWEKRMRARQSLASFYL
jgi:hypothetical protein